MRICLLLFALAVAAQAAHKFSDPRPCSAFRRLAQKQFIKSKGKPMRVDAFSGIHTRVGRGRDQVEVESSFTNEKGQVTYTQILFLRRMDGQWLALRTVRTGKAIEEDEWLQPHVPITSETKEDYLLEKGPIRPAYLMPESQRLQKDYGISDQAINQAYQDLRNATLAGQEVWIPRAGALAATELACLREKGDELTKRLLEGARSLQLTPEQVAAHLEGEPITQTLDTPQEQHYLATVEMVLAAEDTLLGKEIRPLKEKIKKDAKTLQTPPGKSP